MITVGELTITEENWLQISDRAKDLIRRCLDKNPETRILPIEALAHDWLVVTSRSSMSVKVV
jgi:serine/threonine protein kinase